MKPPARGRAARRSGGAGAAPRSLRRAALPLLLLAAPLLARPAAAAGPPGQLSSTAMLFYDCEVWTGGGWGGGTPLLPPSRPPAAGAAAGACGSRAGGAARRSWRGARQPANPTPPLAPAVRAPLRPARVAVRDAADQGQGGRLQQVRGSRCESEGSPARRLSLFALRHPPKTPFPPPSVQLIPTHYWFDPASLKYKPDGCYPDNWRNVQRVQHYCSRYECERAWGQGGCWVGGRERAPPATLPAVLGCCPRAATSTMPPPTHRAQGTSRASPSRRPPLSASGRASRRACRRWGLGRHMGLWPMGLRHMGLRHMGLRDARGQAAAQRWEGASRYMDPHPSPLPSPRPRFPTPLHPPGPRPV
jgi:hypothetical protein